VRAAVPRFIACHRPASEAAIALFGIPFEGRVNLRKGADAGPRDLRLASDSIETYSPQLGLDLEDLPLADLGDCELPDGAPPREQLDAAREAIRAWWRPGLLPFMLGGDHTATVPVIEALAPHLPGLRVIQLDAHPDLREEFLGERYNYASAMARVMDVVPAERVYQVGIRTGSREEYARRRPHFLPAFEVHPVEAVRRVLPELAGHPLYVTIDVDVLDPSEAPGTGSPEPCGLRVAELIEIVRLLGGCAVVGGDLVEVAHAWDPSGRTGIAAAWVIREALLAWWGPRARAGLPGQP
jgi:agmatinase